VDAVRQSTSSTALPDVAVTARHALNEWELVTPETVVKLIGNAPNKSCQLDVAPTWLVKQYSRLLAAFIALLFNASLSTGCFPAKFKHAIVTPLIGEERHPRQQSTEKLPTGFKSTVSLQVIGESRSEPDTTSYHQ